MTKLYDLTGQIKELNELAANPEMGDAVRDTLEALDMELTDKAANIMGLVANRNSDLDAIDAEIERLSARKKTIKNFQDRLKDYLRENMEAADIKKIECPLFTISLAKGRDVVVIDEADDLPDEFIDVKITEKPIKADILKALKAGDTVPGARMVKTKSSVRIK